MKKTYLSSIAFIVFFSGEPFMHVNAPLDIFHLSKTRHSMAIKFLFNV